MAELESLRQQVVEFAKERERWEQERERLNDELETLRSRCQKLARAAAAPAPAPAPQPDVQRADAWAQTEPWDAGAASAPAPVENGGAGHERLAAGRLPAVLEQMLRSPKDEAVQLRGIETLFQQQTQVEGVASGGGAGAAALQASLQAAVAVFGNHQGNGALLLKACQLLSVLLAEPGAQQQLSTAVLWQAAQAVVAVSVQLLAELAAAAADGGAGLADGRKAGGAAPNPPKLLNWFLSLLVLLLPCLGPQLRSQAQADAFVHDLLANLVSKLLASAELAPQEALVLKCVQLLPLLPMEPWLQKTCLTSGAVHSLTMVYQRWRRGALASGLAVPDAPLAKAVHAAVKSVFGENLELCVKAVDDTFVNDEFVCLEVLEQLRMMEKRRRGTFRDLDKDHGIIGKVLNLWSWHQRAALEASAPERSPSREVLRKVAELLTAVCLKLSAPLLLQRMKEFEHSDVFQRVALASVHGSAQLRLQLAVNYAENGVVPVVIGCMQGLLQGYEGAADTAVRSSTAAVEAAFALLRDEALPAEGWPYLHYCLEVCLHVLSHWSATKLSLKKADVMDASSAPLQLAQGGLVDSLAEIVDPKGAGVELIRPAPPSLVTKATETLQALFEQNGHICLFCMGHYGEVKLMTQIACECLCLEPLAEHFEMQQQAVAQCVEAFDRFSATDERLGRKILRALAALFESSSYRLVAWFLSQYGLCSLGEYQSVDIHVEAVRAVARTPYWSAEDAPVLPEFISLLAQVLLDAVEGQADSPKARVREDGSRRRVLDLTEAEELVFVCMASVLHLLLIDPTPPAVLRILARRLAGDDASAEALPGDSPCAGDERGGAGDERAVSTVMRIMTVFPSSDRVQLNCQHLLTSLLGE